MTITVAGIQHATAWHDPPANFARLAPKIAAAAADGADLVVLPEMYSTGFSMDTAVVAEEEDGPSTAFLREQAAAHGVAVAASIPIRTDRADVVGDLPEDRRGMPFNWLRIVDAGGGDAGEYRKIHPFSYADEDEHYNAGGGTATATVGGVTIGLFVCYDLRFAQEFWRLAPEVDAYVVPANWPASRRHHWVTLLQARAIENQAYVIGVNRCGEGGGLDYSGDSMIIDPLGEVVADAGADETTVSAPVAPDVVADVRARFPFMQDRRSYR